MRARISRFLPVLFVISACSERAAGPTGLTISAARGGLPASAALASPDWQALTASAVSRTNTAPVAAGRLYALVFVRPWQADAGITVVAAVGKPNHPSYPSGHSCVSSSAGEVLSTWFPGQRAQFEAMVTEAGLSRMYGGIHYRFDIEAGRALGLNVARFAIERDASGNSVLTPH